MLLFTKAGIPVRLAFCFIIAALFISIPQKISAQTVFYGDTVALGSGFAFTWIETDAQNAPVRLGISLTEAAVDNPASGLKSVEFPEAAVDSLFKHALFAFEPQGHGPTGVYNVPHFDIHFYMITKAERQTIPQGIDPVPIHSVYMPEDYRPIDGFFSIPQMGVHFADSLSGEFNGRPFDKTLLYGFYKAKMLFIEPMVTREFLLTKPDTMITVKQPEGYQRNAFYPESYVIRYNSQDSLYEIFITDFVLRTALTSTDDLPELLNKNYVLRQNYPNPFNPSTIIQFGFLSESHVRIEVYNMLGELVDILADEIRPAGNHSISWSPDAELSSGVYIYKMEASDVTGTNSFSSFKKMLLMK